MKSDLYYSLGFPASERSEVFRTDIPAHQINYDVRRYDTVAWALQKVVERNENFSPAKGDPSLTVGYSRDCFPETTNGDVRFD